MTDIPKVGGLSVSDALFIAAAKIGSEQVLGRIPQVGNGTYRSALVKGIVAMSMSMLPAKKFTRPLATGVGIDAAEDLVLRLISQSTGFRAGTGTSNGVSTSTEVFL